MVEQVFLHKEAKALVVVAVEAEIFVEIEGPRAGKAPSSSRVGIPDHQIRSRQSHAQRKASPAQASRPCRTASCYKRASRNGRRGGMARTLLLLPQGLGLTIGGRRHEDGGRERHGTWSPSHSLFFHACTRKRVAMCMKQQRAASEIVDNLDDTIPYQNGYILLTNQLAMFCDVFI